MIIEGTMEAGEVFYASLSPRDKRETKQKSINFPVVAIKVERDLSHMARLE